MKRTVLVMTVISLFIVSATAQEQAGTQVSAHAATHTKAAAKTQKADTSTEITAGTQVNAELLSTLDAGKARPGDEVKLRLTRPVMAGGTQVIKKGSILVGHVTEATKAEGKQGVSQVRLIFDELRHKEISLPFSASLEQITKANIQSSLGDDSLMHSSTASSSTRASAQSGGGLLGGVTGTVGGVVGGVTDTTSSAVGSVTGTTRQSLGQVLAVSSDTVNTTAGKASGLISISSETSAQTASSSTLSLTGRNVKIEKGAVFLLRTDKSLALTGNR